MSDSWDKPLPTISDEVRDNYAANPQVDMIMHRAFGSLLRFWIFTSNERYDDALMTDLIGTEMWLIKEFSYHIIDIRFVPLVMCPDPRYVAGDAVVLYQREVSR